MVTVTESLAQKAITENNIESLPWTTWDKMPAPSDCRLIRGPLGPGVYQIRNSVTKQKIQFGIGQKCAERMTSLYPAPYGSSGRDNMSKRNFILENFKVLEYRTLRTTTRKVAADVETYIKNHKDHLFNT